MMSISIIQAGFSTSNKKGHEPPQYSGVLWVCPIPVKYQNSKRTHPVRMRLLSVSHFTKVWTLYSTRNIKNAISY